MYTPGSSKVIVGWGSRETVRGAAGGASAAVARITRHSCSKPSSPSRSKVPSLESLTESGCRPTLFSADATATGGRLPRW